MSMPDDAVGLTKIDGTDPSLDGWAADLADRLLAGEPVDLEAYARAHPDRADRLRRLMQTMARIARLDDSEGRPSSDRAAAPEPDPGAAPETLGEFRILREIGKGGMGVVYEADQPSLQRRVALKVLPPAAALDPRLLQRFQLEAQAVATLNHPHIVPIYCVGRDRGVPYYAMQRIDGHSLAEIIRELRSLDGMEPTDGGTPIGELTRSLVEGRLAPAPGGSETPTEAVRRPGAAPPPADRTESGPAPAPARGRAFFRMVAGLGFQAAEALAHTHELGILHRDIKPANLLVDARGHLWVTDFGLARLQADSALTRSGDLLGTLRYMSPEQALGRRGLIDGRTDIYALGATLYELLTLRPAYEGDDRQEILARMAQAEPRPPRRLNPAVPADLETIVLKAMARDPAERYATARELAEDLGRFLADAPIRARPIGPLARARRWAVQPRRVRDAGRLAMGYGATLLIWTLLSFFFLAAGMMPPPARPAEFARDVTLTSLGDLVPAIVLGWLTARGRTWALRAGTVAATLRVAAQVNSFLGHPPQFGGYYDDPHFRSMMLGIIILMSVLILAAHLLALVASHDDRET